MDPKILAKRIADRIKCSEKDTNAAFLIFKDKVSEYLSIGEALKIDQLGIFQLKEQIGHSDSTKILAPGDKKLTLLFSPNKEGNLEENLFINLELHNQEKYENEFDENIFVLGIGKKLITDIDSDEGSESSSSQFEEIKKSIDNLIVGSEKIQNFDLWDDHLKSKETTNILEEEILDDEFQKNDDNKGRGILDDDFVPLDEDEILDDYIDNNDLITEESENNLVDEIDLEEKSQETYFEEEIEKKLDDVFTEIEEPEIDGLDLLDEIEDGLDLTEEDFDLSEDPKEDELQLDKHLAIEDNIEEKLQESSPVEIEESAAERSQIDEKISGDKRIETDEEITSTLIDETSSEISQLEEEIPEDRQIEVEEASAPIVMDEVSSEISQIEEEIVEEQEAETVEESMNEHDAIQESSGDKPQKSNMKKFLLVFVAFILVALIASYYLFFNNATGFVETDDVETSITDVTKDKEKPVEEDPQKDVIDDKALQKETATPVEVTQEDPTKLDKKEEVAKETEVSQNIYFNGIEYNVQISSWKNKSIAEREVEKLIAKGYPAFIIKVYIAKLDGTWHRVRVGPYKSLDEAKSVKENL